MVGAGAAVVINAPVLRGGHERLRGAANELKANLLVGGARAVVRCEDAPTHAHVPAVDGAVLASPAVEPHAIR